ncbi:hypothetical protein C6P42_001560, partial [Pichia californica]
MAGGRQHLESKRKLFRAIATRISHHNHISAVADKEDFKDDKDKEKEFDESRDSKDITAAHSPYNDSTNINTNSNINNSNSTNPNVSCTHAGNVELQQQQQQQQQQLHEDYRQHVSLPVTQGSEQTNFSYLESVKKAPTKKRPICTRSTPNNNLKINNTNNMKIRGVISNNNIDNDNNDNNNYNNNYNNNNNNNNN